MDALLHRQTNSKDRQRRQKADNQRSTDRLTDRQTSKHTTSWTDIHRQATLTYSTVSQAVSRNTLTNMQAGRH